MTVFYVHKFNTNGLKEVEIQAENIKQAQEIALRVSHFQQRTVNKHNSLMVLDKDKKPLSEYRQIKFGVYKWINVSAYY